MNMNREGLTLDVLVVEDEKSNRLLLGAFLAEQGHRAIPAENGAEGVALFGQHRPDVVLMDIVMPEMDGYEAARRIKALAGERWAPVIFLSSLNREDDLVQGLEAGGDDYLFKPISFSVLSAKLRSLQRTLALQRSADESRRRLQTVSDCLIDALVTIDEHAVIQSANPATTQLFGYEASELIGRNVKMLMPEPQRSAHDGHVRRYVEGGRPHIIGAGGREVTCLRKDGSRFEAELGVSEASHGGQRLFIGVLRDISERKRAARQLEEYATRLRDYHDAAEEENRLAREIMECQAYGKRLREPGVRFWVAPARHFSGDVVSALRAPDGRLYLMLADATGHGLAAAISVLQALNLFGLLAGSGLPLGEIVHEMNARIREAMPVGRFVAAGLLMVDAALGRGEIWVGGMPDILRVDGSGRVLGRFASRHLPLGIADGDGAAWQTEAFDWHDAEQLVLCSDGLLEAENARGEAFGAARLAEALVALPQARLGAVRAAIEAHLEGMPTHDDISLALVDLAPQAA
jgi:PAS domain S-box-containing protein